MNAIRILANILTLRAQIREMDINATVFQNGQEYIAKLVKNIEHVIYYIFKI